MVNPDMVDPAASADRPRGQYPFREAALIFAGSLALAASAFWWLTLPTPRDRSRVSVATRFASGREPNGPYIGSKVCRECHPGESALFSRSGHARTLRPAASLPLAHRLDGRALVDPETPGVTWRFHLRDGEFGVERRKAGAVEQFVIDYAFGSDHHATTFVTLNDPSAPLALEHRLTHFAAEDSLGITPGHTAAEPSPGLTPHGRELSPEDTRKCFRCHSTRPAIPDEGWDVRDLIPNVSCERCHGPARRHVVDARAGRTDLPMPFGLESWTAETQLALCGQCHRHPSRATPGAIRPDNTALARFQPVGIAQSKCYKRSAGALSCVNCHDPHGRASSDVAGYEAACLRCHERPRNSGCPVSPRTGCIGCHMPKVDSGQRVLFTDHWIRVRERPGAGERRAGFVRDP